MPSQSRDQPETAPAPPGTTGAVLRRIVADRRVAFLLVGGFNVVQGVGWFALFHAMLGGTLPYLWVLVLAYVPAILLGFLLYRALVFKVRGQALTDLARFTLVQAGAFGINAISLPAYHELLHMPLLVSQAMAVVTILISNYFGHLYFSFRRSHPATGASAAR